MRQFWCFFAAVFATYFAKTCSLRCFVCNRLKNTTQKPCPGELRNFPGAEACRLLAFNNGEILNQSPVARKLCTTNGLKASRRKIAQDFSDGNGITACCMWDGCNGSAEKATKTRAQYQKYLLDKAMHVEQRTFTQTQQEQQQPQQSNSIPVKVNSYTNAYYISTEKMATDKRPESYYGMIALPNGGWKMHNSGYQTPLMKADESASEPPKNGGFQRYQNHQYKKSGISQEEQSQQLHSLAQRSAASRTLSGHIRSILWLIIISVIVYVIQRWFFG